MTIDKARPRSPAETRPAAAAGAAGANKPAAAAAIIRPPSIISYEDAEPQMAFPTAKMIRDHTSSVLLSARPVIVIRTGEPMA
jgi:hypothetical protein